MFFSGNNVITNYMRSEVLRGHRSLIIFVVYMLFIVSGLFIEDRLQLIGKPLVIYRSYTGDWLFYIIGFFIGYKIFVGYRSVTRDVEAQMIIHTKNQSLRARIHEEKERLFCRSEIIDSSMSNTIVRKYPLWTRIVFRLFRHWFQHLIYAQWKSVCFFMSFFD